MLQKEIIIMGERRSIFGDVEYLEGRGEEYEPETTSLLAALCDADATALDIGANIGLTSLALAKICCDGAVFAIEPVPYTFELLNKNLQAAGVNNVSSYKLAIGASEGSVSMYVNERNLATSFVVDIDVGSAREIPLTSLDVWVPQLAIERLDFIKIDVEGCELEVLKGAENTLKRFKPIVMLEMNHWCLNIFRGISLPAFREKLLQVFPYVFAVEKGSYLDFSDPVNAGPIYQDHVFGFHYVDIVAGFDRAELVARLDRLTPAAKAGPAPEGQAPEGQAPVDPVAAAISAEAQLQAVLNSRSWKLTAPMRYLAARVRALLP